MDYSGILSPAGERRLDVGLMVQPFVAGLLGFALIPVVGVAFFVGIFAIPITALGAYPVIMRLLRRGTLTLRHSLLGGALLGTIPGLVGDALTAARLAERNDWLFSAMRPIVFGLLIGIGGAAVFWWLAGRHLMVERQTAS
jgi:hypothetical protein